MITDVDRKSASMTLGRIGDLGYWRAEDTDFIRFVELKVSGDNGKVIVSEGRTLSEAARKILKFLTEAQDDEPESLPEGLGGNQPSDTRAVRGSV